MYQKAIVVWVLAVGVALAALYFEPYKFKIMQNHICDQKPYEIFPWSKDPQDSGSSPVWLIIHLATALFHLLLSAYMFLRYNYELRNLYEFSHVVFSVFIMTNLYHFGEYNPYVAMVINGVPLFVALVTFDKKQESWWMSLWYFLAIASPVVFETVMYLRR
jgi:hypothetical protein